MSARTSLIEQPDPYSTKLPPQPPVERGPIITAARKVGINESQLKNSTDVVQLFSKLAKQNTFPKFFLERLKFIEGDFNEGDIATLEASVKASVAGKGIYTKGQIEMTANDDKSIDLNIKAGAGGLMSLGVGDSNIGEAEGAISAGASGSMNLHFKDKKDLMQFLLRIGEHGQEAVDFIFGQSEEKGLPVKKQGAFRDLVLEKLTRVELMSDISANLSVGLEDSKITKAITKIVGEAPQLDISSDMSPGFAVILENGKPKAIEVFYMSEIQGDVDGGNIISLAGGKYLRFSQEFPIPEGLTYEQIADDQLGVISDVLKSGFKGGRTKLEAVVYGDARFGTRIATSISGVGIVDKLDFKLVQALINGDKEVLEKRKEEMQLELTTDYDTGLSCGEEGDVGGMLGPVKAEILLEVNYFDAQSDSGVCVGDVLKDGFSKKFFKVKV